MVSQHSPFSDDARPSREALKAWLRSTRNAAAHGSAPRDALELAESQRMDLERKLGHRPETARRRATLRFYGDPVRGNEMPASVAVVIIGDFQAMVTSVAEALRDTAINNAPKAERGYRRRQVRSAVDLLFSPEPTRGSTVFHLWESKSDPEPGSEQDLLTEEGGQPLVDLAVGRIFDLLEAVSERSFDEDRLKSLIKEMGKKHASSIEKLTKELLKNGLNLDLIWGAADQPKRKAIVRRAEAMCLNKLVHDQTRENVVEVLYGELITVSSIRKVDLRLDSGRVISAEMTPALRGSEIARFYGHRVRVLSDVKRYWSGTTDSVKELHTFRHIQFVDDESNTLMVEEAIEDSEFGDDPSSLF